MRSGTLLSTLLLPVAAALAGCANESSFRNQPVKPIAVIDGNASGPASTLFEFEIDGRDSYDPNALEQNGIYEWEWWLESVPDNATATIDPDGRDTVMVTDTPGVHVIGLRVRDINDFAWSDPDYFAVRAFPITGFTVELRWNTDVNDVDLHLVDETMGGGLFDNELDCHFANLRPDWGAPGIDGDPSLNHDELDGYGPEVVQLPVPTIDNRYHLLVHYFSDDGYAETDANIRVWINGEQVAELEREIAANDLWDVGVLDWTGALGTFSGVDTVSVY